ncbi:MAG: SDR family oxidoreductase [Deltaproteobacteria bacterium]|nr:MAG: SDR family oxidoreductase [Deltaproteobacteria bacterium]
MSERAGRVAVVTGAGTGIGRAVALRLAADGARLGLVGRDRERLEEVAAELGGDAVVAAADVRDAAAVDAAFAAIAERLGPLHALVANAGVGGPNRPGPGGEGDRWDEIVRTNLDGSYASARAFERRLAPGPGARHMVVIASCLARFGVPGYTAYCASKAGLLGMVRAFALEWAEHDVLVNAICPGWVDTEMAQRGMQDIAEREQEAYEAVRARVLAETPLDRISPPEEIAGVVAFLLSPDARAFTGQAIDPNNGSWMG